MGLLPMDVKDKLKRHASLGTRGVFSRCKVQESENIKLSEVEDSPRSDQCSIESLSKPASLSKIVGDPFAAEKTWMAACTVAGSQSLHGDNNNSRTKAVLLAILTFVGAVTGGLAAMLLFPLSYFFAGHVSWLFTAVNMDTFMRASMTPQVLGFYIGLIANAAFWATALDSRKSKHLRRSLSFMAVFLAVLLYVGAVSSGSITLVGGLILAALTLGICFASRGLGSLLRDHLPKSLSVPKLLRSTLWGLLAPAILCGVSIAMAFAMSSSGEPSRPYSPATSSALAIVSIMLAYSAMVPGFCMAIASKSKSISGCAFLSVVTQSPLLLGLGLTSIAAFGALFGFFPTDGPLPNGLLDATTLSIAFLSVCGMTALGGALGASCNKMSKKK